MTPLGTFLLALSITHQAPTPGQAQASLTTALVAGRVTSVELGRPVRKASVKLVRRSPRMTFTTTTDADGRFRFVNLTPGEYTLSASKPGYLEMALGARRPGSAGQAASMRLLAGEARENLSLHLPRAGISGGVLKCTSRSSELTGTLSSASGTPVDDWTVVLFPSDRDYWVPQSRRIQTIQTDLEGKFVIRGLPPGDYRLAAIEWLDPGQQFDLEFLSGLVAGASAVTVEEGSKRTHDLRVR